MLKTEDKHIDWPIVFSFIIMIGAAVYFGAHIIGILFEARNSQN